MTHDATTRTPSDAELKAILTARLSMQGNHGQIAHIFCQPWNSFSSFRMEALSLTFEDGFLMPTLMKDVSPTGRLRFNQNLKPEFLYEPRREIEVYQTLLAPDADAPRFIAAEIDESSGRYLLFIEHVDGLPLWQAGKLDMWLVAARWLASFHQSAQKTGGPAGNSLLKYNRLFYAVWPKRAAEFIRRNSLANATTKSFIEQLSSQYQRVIDRLSAAPTQLIHGEFVPSNILVQQSGQGPRIRVVDWEMAALGPTMMDLADLTGGDWSESDKATIVDAYFDGLQLSVDTDQPQCRELLNWCRLHKAVQWLGWAENWTPPKEHTHNWLTEAERLAQTLGII